MTVINRLIKNSDNPYVMIDKQAISDCRVSWKAKGILAYLLSKPDDWRFYESEIISNATDGRESLRNGFKELIDAGYLVKEQVRDEHGKYNSCDYHIHERPIGKAVDGKPVVGKPPTTNKDSTKKDKTKDILSSSTTEPSNIPYKEITERLNKLCGKQYRHTTNALQTNIKARWNEGFRLPDFEKVIKLKASQWKDDPKMNKYLRPETLFSNKFDGYLNEEQTEKKPYKITE